MSSVPNISLSVMNASQTALSATAFNIATAATEVHRRRKVQHTSLSAGGVVSAVVQGDPSGAEGLVADVVDMLQAKNSILANVAVFETSSRMTGGY